MVDKSSHYKLATLVHHSIHNVAELEANEVTLELRWFWYLSE